MSAAACAVIDVLHLVSPSVGYCSCDFQHAANLERTYFGATVDYLFVSSYIVAEAPHRPQKSGETGTLGFRRRLRTLGWDIEVLDVMNISTEYSTMLTQW